MSFATGLRAATPAIRSLNRSKRYAASCGPAAASGWYCTEKLRRSPSGERSSSPSTTSSLRQTWLTVAMPYAVSVGRSSGASTANPWLCAVTSTLPVVRSITGWLILAVAVLQLEVPKPSARPKSWLPKQIPK